MRERLPQNNHQQDRQEVDRRGYIKLAGLGLGAVLFGGAARTAEATGIQRFAEWDPPASEVMPPSTLPDVLSQIDARSDVAEDEKKKLKDFLIATEQDKLSVMKTVWDHHVLEGLWKRKRTQLVRDIDIYYPIYKAAEERFRIPWQLFWVVHEQETEASSAKWPDHSNLTGCMQINYVINGSSRELITALKQAIDGQDYLTKHPSLRYDITSSDRTKHRSRSNDAREIFASGAFMDYFTRPDRNKRVKSTDTREEQCLKAQLNYFGALGTWDWRYREREKWYKQATTYLPVDQKFKEIPQGEYKDFRSE